jgi:hypothetical protein
MLGYLLKRGRRNSFGMSQLYNEQTFYKAFERSKKVKKEIIIESPFLTMRRVTSLIPLLQKAKIRGVSVIINTRNPIELTII